MKIAIVTGASSGMGKEFVRQIERFYRELDEIWVIARSEKKLEEIKKSHKTYIRIFALQRHTRNLGRVDDTRKRIWYTSR